MVAEANGWNSRFKAFHLAASLRGDTANIFETFPEEQRHDFQALSGALELRFGGKCTKEYSPFSDCLVEIRQDLSLQHFIDSVRDLEIQNALRLADVKDIGSAFVYSHKIEAAQQVTRKD
ncbi:retrovirus-related Pol polyprotein from transposon 412 [Nephila pilipes]|uniref:Retrovirus-related Pol polyprotein from transposon 412 n=1 Tax=Nephila pilipes TaxID=299642 RepID=A0A8X6IYN1_NEPPI|nr:retrovirus-related Pol polyprotein from transposon 412 [Nephila pilipes]